MSALRNGNVLDVKDIPEGLFFEDTEDAEPVAESVRTAAAVPAEAGAEGDARRQGDDDPLLKLIETLLKEGILLGRRRLLEEARAKGICSSEYQLRKRLTELEHKGKIIMGKGKVGIRLR